VEGRTVCCLAPPGASLPKTSGACGVSRLGAGGEGWGGRCVRWRTYDHELHGFAYVARGADGRYAPDAVQREVVADSIAFFDAHLK